MNRKRREMVRFLEKRGWGILNGSTKEDEEGEYTYTGRKKNTIIDYVIGNEMKEKIRMMRIGDKIESDHQPVEVRVKGERSRQGRKEGGRMREKKSRRGIWNEEGCRLFRQKMDRMKSERKDGRMEWEEMKKRIKKAIEEVERNMGKVEEKKGVSETGNVMKRRRR